MNIALIDSNGRSHRVRLATLQKHFHYFSHSEAWEKEGADLVHRLSFSPECLERLDDALVAGTHPSLEDEDAELIDYLQPKDPRATYLCYTLPEDHWSLALFDSNESGANELSLFLGGFTRPYVNYLAERGWDNLCHISPCEKNLEDLWNQCMVHYSQDGLPGIEAYLSSVPLVRIWHGDSPQLELLEEVKTLVIDCAMKSIESPSTPRDTLYLLVASLVPELTTKNESFSLPWNVTLPEGDNRSMIVHACSVGRIPLKKDIKLPHDPYWDVKDDS